MAKARCPRCGKRMNPKEAYGRRCGHKNPLFTVSPAKPAMAVKTARSLAPVVDYQAVRAARLLQIAAGDSNPETREITRGMAIDIMKGGAA